MILSDKKIVEEMKKGAIVIDPFDIKNMGGNSYDVHLSKHFAQYVDKTLDAKKHNKVKHFEITEKGFVLKPGQLYLCTTEEYTESHKHVPFLEGKSSTGRLGINIHATPVCRSPNSYIMWWKEKWREFTPKRKTRNISIKKKLPENIWAGKILSRNKI